MFTYDFLRKYNYQLINFIKVFTSENYFLLHFIKKCHIPNKYFLSH